MISEYNVCMNRHRITAKTLANCPPDHAHDLQLIGGRFLDGGKELEGAAEVTRDAVVKNSKLTLWRQEVQSACRIKLVQLHALVEVAVIQYHGAIAVALA